MTNQPLFSVLIANYNNGKYLIEAIESVRQQTYTNWEIIMVDDSSTDNSHELYNELEADERIHIFLNDQNHGCGYTKRRCAELANGEICGFLDPDDVLTEEALQMMVEKHTQNPNASIVFSQHYDTDENLNIVAYPKNITMEEANQMQFSAFGQTPSHFTTFKKMLYNKTEGIDSEKKRAVDMDMYYKLEEVGTIKFIPQPLYFYRHNTGSNISLGEINERRALYWDFICWVDTCRRRGFSIEQYAFPSFEKSMSMIIEDKLYAQELKIRTSKTYRLGKAILKPLMFFKKCCK